MPTAVKVKKQYEYIPDSSHAVEWITPDIFKNKWGRYFRVELDGTIVKAQLIKRGGNHA